jgi:SAM-dependent methyltransferase
MGYTVDYFSFPVESWLDQGWLKRGARLIDFGAQEFYCEPAAARASVRAFLERRGLDDEAIARAAGGEGKVLVADVYRAIGIDYLAIDVDESYGSTFFDLNSFAPPIEWRGAFDFVNNEGTIEHLINPINGFQVAHELLKCGGIARHSMPLTGHRDHGLVYPTVKFYRELLSANGYRLLQAKIGVKQSPLDLNDPRFELVADDGGPLAPSNRIVTDAWLHLVYRKVRPAEFRAPFDHLAVGDPAALGERLSATFSAYGRTRLTASVPRDPAGDALERAQEPLGARFARVLKDTARSVGLTRARLGRIKVARRLLGHID